MKTIFQILIGLLILSCNNNKDNYGNLVITNQPIYELENTYSPHDYFSTKYFMDEDLMDEFATIQKKGENISILNTINDGYTGHRIEFIISEDLNILKATYNEWTDVIDGSEVNYKVEKVILSVSSNPFKNKLVTGHYTLQIREDYLAGELLKAEYQDTTLFRVFNGKFKIYSSEEINKGENWVLEKYKSEYGVED